MELGEARTLALSAAALLELRIDPALLDGVAANLVLLARHASRVMAFPLPPEAEAAPVFDPCGEP